MTSTTSKSPRSIRRRMCQAALALAMSGSVLVVLASPASAEQICNSGNGYVVCFDLTRLDDGNIAVHIGIDVAMSRQDAQSIIDAPGEEFSAAVMGDDPYYDNTQVSVPVTWSAAWEGGLSAEFDRVATFAQLNEDDGFFDGYIDELYARIRLFDPRTQRTRTFTSRNITGYY